MHAFLLATCSSRTYKVGLVGVICIENITDARIALGSVINR